MTIPTKTVAVIAFFAIIYLQCLTRVQAKDPVVDKCKQYSNKTCSDCVKNDGCYYCVPTKKCAGGVVKATIHADCKDNQWKVGQCVLTGKVLLIVLPTLAGVLLIALCCCVYCCCCRKKKKGSKREDKQEAKWRRQREDIEIKHTERRAERQQKYDDIRRKYGLFRKGDGAEDDGKYQQFSNEA